MLHQQYQSLRCQFNFQNIPITHTIPIGTFSFILTLTEPASHVGRRNDISLAIEEFESFRVLGIAPVPLLLFWGCVELRPRIAPAGNFNGLYGEFWGVSTKAKNKQKRINNLIKIPHYQKVNY